MDIRKESNVCGPSTNPSRSICWRCGGYGMKDYDTKGRPIPCSDCDGTGLKAPDERGEQTRL